MTRVINTAVSNISLSSRLNQETYNYTAWAGHMAWSIHSCLQ